MNALAMFSGDSYLLLGFPDGSVVKNVHLPMKDILETWVPSLGQEDPLEKEIATHSRILA